MSHWSDFVQAVIASPDDDGLRLVCADWLDEQGDAARAEFIRVQCEIARLNGDETERLSALAVREKELWEAYSKAWTAELPRWAHNRVYFRRGFASIAHCTPTQCIAGRLMRSAPIQSLEIRLFDAAKVARLAASPHLASVRALRPGTQLPAERTQIIHALSDSACAAGLRVLDLSDGAIAGLGSTWGDGPVEALSESKLTALECLRLSSSQIGPAGVRTLATSPIMAGLRKLDLMQNDIGRAGARAIGNSPHVQNLTALNVSFCALTDAGVEALTASPYLGRLTHLKLSDHDLTEATARAVAAAPHINGLTALSLRYCDLGRAGAAILASAPNLAHLTYLDLYWTGIGDDGFQELVESPYLKNLRTLEVGANGLTERGLQALAAHGMKRLERLGLLGEYSLREAARKLIGSRRLPRLRLRQIGFDTEGGLPLWIENATQQEIDEHFLPLHGETVAKRF